LRGRTIGPFPPPFEVIVTRRWPHVGLMDPLTLSGRRNADFSLHDPESSGAQNSVVFKSLFNAFMGLPR
jgi:hypothetical protein